MGAMQNFVDGFKPIATPHKNPADITVHDYHDGHSNGKEDVEKGLEDAEMVVPHGQDEKGAIALTTDESGLKRHLTGRHMQMIAFGGSIGTGLFIGSGGALANGGPGSLLIDFILIGIMLYTVVMALGELATVLPVTGSFAAYSTRFIDPAWGFAMGYNYWMQWFIVLPLELTAASIVINYWDPNETVPKGIWVMIFLIAITIINLFGVRGYGEVEFVASMVKIIAVIIFIFVGIVINSGGAPAGQYLGSETWRNPGAFNNGFKGFCSVFVTAAFAFAGTELIGLAAAETGNPRKEVPKASKQIFWRILIFYVVSLFIITLIVPYDDANLLNGSSSYDAAASPFVIAIKIGGINALPSIMNAVILVSVLSVGNSAVYGASRTLNALAMVGQAPRIFRYIDRQGRPLPAVALSLAMGALGFLIYASNATTVFNWLLALSGLSSIFTWGSVCWCHIRFRSAWKARGHTVEELPWSSPVGVWGSYFGLSFNCLVLIATFYVSAFPIGEGELNANDRAQAFFQGYLAAPVVFLFFIGYKFWYRTRFVKISQIDVDTGRKDPVPLEVLRQEREEAAAAPLYMKVYRAMC